MTIHKKSNYSKSKPFSQKELTDSSRKLLKNISNKLEKNQINQFAVESKFIQRSSSKITGHQFLTAMLISSADSEQATLEKIGDIFASHFRVDMRAQSIMERLNNNTTVGFLKNVFKCVLDAQFSVFLENIQPELFTLFSKILIQDSTRCDLHQKLSSFFKGSGGRASASSLKLDVIYDFKAKKFAHITLHSGSVADQALAKGIMEHVIDKTLIIRDLGYLQIDCILKIIELGAFFLSRMKNNFVVYLNENDMAPLDLAKYLHENFRKVNVVDMKIYITEKKIGVRLVAYRVPPEIAARRRQVARAKAKKEGRTLSQKSLTLLDFSIFVTNVSAEIWPTGVVGTIYRIRWQIELMFKDWKKRLKINCLQGINPYRIQCLIYIRLIYILLINEIYMFLDYVGMRCGREVSMHKVYNWLKNVSRLLQVLSGRFSWWEERHLDNVIMTSMLQQKRKRKTSLQSIHEQDFYYAKVS